MSRHHARLLILLLNVPQVVAAAALAVYSIWFDRYEWRNVGVGVTYAAYVFLVILISQLVNGVGWLFLRTNKAMAAFWVRVALASFSCVVVFIWLGGKFIYAGT
jgi:hypothetical protein